MGRKKVLVITYYWPPSGGIGVQRCLKIVKYLRDFGWEPVVYTAKDAQYPVFDYGNLNQVPEGITILKQPIIEPFTFYKILTGRKKDDPLLNVLTSNKKKTGFLHSFSVWLRSNFFIPDARSLWINPSVRFLLKYLQANPVDAIFTDGPPHTNTMIACYLKQKTGIPWLSDFQDPWTQVDYYKLLKLTKWADKKHHRMEQEVFRTADKMTIVSDTWKKDLESIGAKNVSVIPWGYDPDDFKERSAPNYKKFVISHVGLLSSDRNPDIFFQSIKDLLEESPDLKKVLEIRLVGSVDVSVVDAAKENELEQYLNLQNQVSRKEALNIMQESSVLLLLLNKAHNVMGRIPGKLFEYMASERFILCLGPVKSDVDNIITSVNAGVSVPYENKEEIKDQVRALYKLWERKDIKPLTTGIEKYSILELTKKIAGFLNEISGK